MISRSRTGCPWENGYQESFYDKFKVDLGDPNRFKTLGELVAEIYRTVWDFSSQVWEATGTAERDAAMTLLQDVPGRKRVTVGGDKGFDTAEFVRECRNLRVTPHVAQNRARRGGSAVDGRTTQHQGYHISRKKRKRERFGWLKTSLYSARCGIGGR